MNCRKGWTRDMMLDKFSRKFVTQDYKKHRENVLFDKEKSLLPATQPYAEKEQRKREMMKAIADLQTDMEREIRASYNLFPAGMQHEHQVNRIKERMQHIVSDVHPSSYLDHCIEFNCKYPCTGKVRNKICQSCYRRTCTTCGKIDWKDIMDKHQCNTDDIQKEAERKNLVNQYKLLLSNVEALHQCNQLHQNIANIKKRYKDVIDRKKLELHAFQRKHENDQGERKEKRTFVRACPVNDCRGFLSSSWKCGMCNIQACSTCHEVKDKHHVCIPANVETAKLLAKDTKPCPSCASQIFKVSGCDQMWCVECHTTFSWTSGQILRGNIHNPHYYEYMRNRNGTQREIRDVPCGGIPDYGMLHKHMRNVLSPNELCKLEPYHRAIGEVMDLRTWYRSRNMEEKRDIRVKYLLKDYTDAYFKKILQMKAKAQEKITNIDQVLDMFVMASSSIFQRMMATKKAKMLKGLFEELEELRKYMNASMEKVSKVYDCKVPSIDEHLRLHRVGERKSQA